MYVCFTILLLVIYIGPNHMYVLQVTSLLLSDIHVSYFQCLSFVTKPFHAFNSNLVVIDFSPHTFTLLLVVCDIEAKTRHTRST
jgi:hypothetical protein